MSRSNRAGQSQVVTAIILAGILIAGITAAYTWGLPLLQKNQDKNTIESSLDQMKELSSTIDSISSRGGSRQVSFDLQSGSLEVNTAEDKIVYIANTRAAYVSTGTWVPLNNERNLQGISEVGQNGTYAVRGKDKPGVIIGKTERLPTDKYKTTFKLVFRPVEDLNTNKLHQIDLEGSGNLRASGGSHSIVIEQGDKVTDDLPSGKPMVKQKINIQIN
jgi:hypothetical protein